VNLFSRLAKFWKKSGEKDEIGPSIVLLLRKPHFFTSAELERAGELGFGKSFDGKQDPMYFVVQESFVTFIKAGADIINMAHSEQPYLGDPQEVARQLPRPEQKRAWLAHTAWASLDSHNDKLPKSEAYAVLARFALQMGDENCSGIYIPGEQVFLPNDGAAEDGLRTMIRGELFA
jgi:hypothetical protein